jgi:Delta3,5-Delta2,4-dienoyl-CoA isomerase
MSAFGIPQQKYFNITSPAEYIAHVEINRPDKLNAFAPPMWIELRNIFNSLSTSPDVRAILITGAGEKAFTAGEDLDHRTKTNADIPGLDVQAASQGELGSNPDKNTDPSRKAAVLRRHILDYQDVISSVGRCEKPVIALMHGFAIGLAIDLSTACDIRLCTDDVKFCVKEVDIGLAADVGTLSRFPKVVGFTSWAKEVALSARFFTAQEAVQNNFVSRSVSGGKAALLEEGLKLAKLIASKSPVAVQGTKNIMDAGYGRVLEDNLNYTAVWNMGMLQSSDTARAMLSGIQKKTPKFEKL